MSWFRKVREKQKKRRVKNHARPPKRLLVRELLESEKEISDDVRDLRDT